MKPAKEYRVRWEIDVEAETPREAAEEARKIQLDNKSIANVFDVYDPSAPTGVTIDLSVIPKPLAGMYLHLFHGRKRYPSGEFEELNDWGADGPYIGPLRWAHTTYHDHIRFEVLEGSGDGIDLAIVEDLVYYKNMYYGDWSWFYYDGVNDWEGGSTAPIAAPDRRDFELPEELPIDVDDFIASLAGVELTTELPVTPGDTLEKIHDTMILRAREIVKQRGKKK